MKPKGTAIENLRSFENGDFNFKEYNVTAGPNNSGKTNPLRILRMPASGDFLDLGTTQEIKFDQGKKNRRQNLQLGLQIWKPRWFYRRQCIDTLNRKKSPNRGSGLPSYWDGRIWAMAWLQTT